MHAKPKKKYRIGIDARFFRAETGGIGRYTRELIHHLAAIDTENEYVIFLTAADLSEWVLNQPNFRPVVVEAPHFTPAEQTVFLKALYAEKLDLVHFLNFNHPLLYTRRFVVTLHDLTLFSFQGASKKSFAKVAAFKLVFKRALRAAKKVIAISEYSAHDAERKLKVPHAKMEVVYEGGPQLMGEMPFGSKAAVIDYLGSKAPYFLFVSSWRPHKGVLTLIQAFNQFKAKTGLPHKLVLAGKQSVIDEDVRELLVSSPYASDIICPGFVPDHLLPFLYHYSLAFVMPSEYEGFGLPVLEAMAAGTTVIVANNSSLPEVAGSAAQYFPTGDTDQLAFRLEEMATQPQVRESLLGEVSAQLAKFSWFTCAERTLGVYKSVLEKRR